MLRLLADGTVQLTRGDTARLTVTITNETTKGQYTIGAEDTLTLTVKRNIEDAEPALQKTIVGESTFHVEPKDTANLTFGKYKFDVELTTAGGDVYTVIEPTTFELTKEVTW